KFYTNLTIPRWTVFLDYILIIVSAIGIGFILGMFLSNIWLLIMVKLLIFTLIIAYVYFDKLKNILSLLKQ
ncbi:MAG TPA: hypothetical protein PLX60_07620, partial [Chitinophagales bacterium]|nr:hypothetical protein [Chitinophagales bacterium]